MLLVQLNLALLPCVSTHIRCWFSSCTVYARTQDVSFMFKLFCYPNLFSWRGYWAIGRAKSTTLLLWSSCGQHLQDKNLKQKDANNSEQSSFILFCSGLEKLYKMAEIVWIDLSPLSFPTLCSIAYCTSLTSLNEDSSVVDCDFLTCNSFSYPQSCLNCRQFEQGTLFHHVPLSVCHDRMLPPDCDIQKPEQCKQNVIAGTAILNYPPLLPEGTLEIWPGCTKSQPWATPGCHCWCQKCCTVQRKS